MYEEMDEVLELIHKMFISLNQTEVRFTTKLLKTTLIKLTNYMKEEDVIFRKLFQNIYFGGSFYHNLKIKKPDEFDIDFLLALPNCQMCGVKNCSCMNIKPSNKPGFLLFGIQEECWPQVYQKFCKNGFMQTNLVYNWFKGLINKAIIRIKADSLLCSKAKDNIDVFFYTECAPALKICVQGKFGPVFIDLAAAFRLDKQYWPVPEKGFRQNSTNKNSFSIVPLSPNGMYAHWRLSYQAQEKEILGKNEKLKTALRLLKLMRDNLHHTVSSYMLKTLILVEADKPEWKQQPSSYIFLFLFEKYITCLRNQNLEYFWHSEVNLLECYKTETLYNHYQEINKLYLKIQREHVTHPTVVAEVLLKKGSNNYLEFMTVWNCQRWLKIFSANLGFSISPNMKDTSSRYKSKKYKSDDTDIEDFAVPKALGMLVRKTYLTYKKQQCIKN